MAKKNKQTDEFADIIAIAEGYDEQIKKKKKKAASKNTLVEQTQEQEGKKETKEEISSNVAEGGTVLVSGSHEEKQIEAIEQLEGSTEEKTNAENVIEAMDAQQEQEMGDVAPTTQSEEPSTEGDQQEHVVTELENKAENDFVDDSKNEEKFEQTQEQEGEKETKEEISSNTAEGDSVLVSDSDEEKQVEAIEQLEGSTEEKINAENVIEAMDAQQEQEMGDVAPTTQSEEPSTEGDQQEHVVTELENKEENDFVDDSKNEETGEQAQEQEGEKEAKEEISSNVAEGGSVLVSDSDEEKQVEAIEQLEGNTEEDTNAENVTEAMDAQQEQEMEGIATATQSEEHSTEGEQQEHVAVEMGHKQGHFFIDESAKNEETFEQKQEQEGKNNDADIAIQAFPAQSSEQLLKDETQEAASFLAGGAIPSQKVVSPTEASEQKQSTLTEHSVGSAEQDNSACQLGNDLQNEIPLKNKKPSKKQTNKLFWIIPIIATVLVLIFGTTIGMGAYFFLKKDTVNPFDYVRFSVTGANGYGKISYDIDKFSLSALSEKEEKRLEALLHEMSFNADKEENLSNGDELVITTDVNEDVLNGLKYKLEKTELKYTVKGLVGFPLTWNDVPQKESFIPKINEVVEKKKQTIVSYYAEKSINDVGKRIELTLTPNFVRMYAKKQPETCVSEEFNSTDNCQKFIFLYRYDITPPAGYTFTVREYFVYAEVDNVYIKEDGMLSDVKVNIFGGDSVMGVYDTEVVAETAIALQAVEAVEGTI